MPEVMNEALEEVRLAHGRESLRQRRVQFDSEIKEKARWSLVRLMMAWASVPCLLAIVLVASWVLVCSRSLASPVVSLAAVALFVESLGIFIFIWRRTWDPKQDWAETTAICAERLSSRS